MAPRIAVLGTTEVEDAVDGGSLTRRDRVVLGALATSHGETLTVDQLSDALWGDEPPKSSAKVVQGSVMRLRRMLGSDAIETDGSGYRLALNGDTVDAQAFERLVARARELAAAHGPERAATTYQQALALWRGAPLPELQEWDPGRAEAERLLEVRRSVEEELVEARMDCGLVAAAVADAQHLVRREPYREHRWALLALALYRSGRQREALDALRRARTTLVDELGLDPGPELSELEQRILQQDPVLLDVPDAPVPVSTSCPWPGLRPFESDQAELYAGRAGEIDECAGRLAAYPLLVVVGASGSGKSSLVRAGLVPRLQAAGGSVAVIAPGAAPLASLSAGIAALGPDDVLVIDQLEELFASTSDDEVVAFLDRLSDEGADGRRVVLTLRADYLASLARSTSFARAAERGLLLLAPMGDEQLRQAIEVPARASGLRLEPGLVDLLLRDVGDDAGGLPLLSHALAETWSRRDGNVLTVAGYRETGGINGAVAQSAERLYESLSTGDRDALRSVLQRLVTPTPAGDPVAARVPTRVFDSTDHAPRLLDLLVRARLVTASADTATLAHESLVRAWPRLRTWLDEDVEGQRVFAHLQVAADGWETGGRPDDELYRGARLETALEWRERTHPVLAQGEIAFLDASAGYAESEDRRRAAELASQKTRNRQLRGALAGVVALLVLALVAGSLAVVRGRQAQDSAAAAQASATRADAARLSAAARSERSIARSLLMAREAVAADRSVARQVDLLDTIVRTQVLSSVDVPRELAPIPRAGDRMNRDGSRYLTSNWDGSVSLLDSATGAVIGGPLATSDGDYGHLSSGAGFYGAGDDYVAVMRDISDDKRPDDPAKAVLRFSARDGRPVAAPEPVPGSRSGDFFGQDMLHIAPDGRTLVSLLDGAVRVWRLQGGAWRGPRLLRLGSAATAGVPASLGQVFLQRVTFSVDSRVASLTVDEQGPPSWATRASIAIDLENLTVLSPWVLDATTAAVARDGRSWAIGRWPTGVEVRSLVDGSVRTFPTVASFAPSSVEWATDGHRLAVGSLDGSVTVYDVAPPPRFRAEDRLDAAVVGSFDGAGAPIVALAVAPDDSVVTVDDGVHVVRRALTGANAVVAVGPTATRVHAVAAGPPGSVVVAGLDDGRVAVLDQRTMRVVRTLDLGPFARPDPSAQPAAHRRVTALGVSPDGRTVLAGNRDGVIKAWSAEDGRLLWTVRADPVEQLAVSPDGRRFATIESTIDPNDAVSLQLPDGFPSRTRVQLWDLADHQVVLSTVVTDPDGNVPKGKMLTFSPDSRLLAVPFLGPSIVHVYQVEQPRLLVALQGDQIDSQFGNVAVTFSPDSRRLLVRADSGDAIIELDPRTGEPIGPGYPGAERGDYGTIAFSADARWLFSRTPLSLSAYDVSNRRLLFNDLPLASNMGEGSMAVAPDGYLYAATDSGVARLDIDPQHWEDVACRLAGRSLTREEWDQLLPGRPYAPACAAAPS